MIQSILVSSLLLASPLWAWAQTSKNMGCKMNEQMTGCIVRHVHSWPAGVNAKLQDGDLLKQVDEIQVSDVHHAGLALQRIVLPGIKYKKVIVSRAGKDLIFLNE